MKLHNFDTAKALHSSIYVKGAAIQKLNVFLKQLKSAKDDVPIDVEFTIRVGQGWEHVPQTGFFTKDEILKIVEDKINALKDEKQALTNEFENLQ